jgi:hypothetical protein
MFLDELLYADIMFLFGTFFDNEPIVERNYCDNELFVLQIIEVNQENGIIVFDLMMKEFATFTIALNLKTNDAHIVSFCDDDDNFVFIDTDIGCVCKEFIRNRLMFALTYYENNFEVLDCLLENVEVLDFDIEIVQGDHARIISKNEKKKISVDFGIGGMISGLMEKKFEVFIISSHIKHNKNDEDCNISIYCSDAESVCFEIVQHIKTYFSSDSVKVKQDNNYWLPLEDGKRFYRFSWK